MSEETKVLEDLKDTVAALAQHMKQSADDRSKQDAILTDLKDRQEKLEKTRRRKGLYADDNIDEDEGKKVVKSGVLSTMIQTKSLDDKVVELQKANDDILMLSEMLKVAPQETKYYQDFLTSNPFLKEAKAMYSTGATVGDEWVPTAFSPQLTDKVRLALKVASLHPTIEMPTNPYKPPVLTTDLVGYYVGERTGDDDTLTAGNRMNASTLGTSQYTLTACKIAGRTWFSEELTEDSIIPILPTLRENIVIALATAMEKATIDGDTAGTHQDVDVTAAYDAKKAWDGYRKSAQSAAKVSIASLTGEAIMNIRKAMGKYGVNPGELALVVGISGYAQLMNIRDSSNNQLIQTLDKYGSSATIMTGELGKIYGIPIIVSEWIRENLNASGVYDGTTTTKTVMVMVYRPGFTYGSKRALTIKTDEDINTDQTVLVATMRKAFAARYAVASNYIVGLGYNLTS